MKSSARLLLSAGLALAASSSSCDGFSASSSASPSSKHRSDPMHHSGQRVFISTPSKSSNKIVSDLMTSAPHLLTLSPHTPVDEAIASLLRAGVSGAPVVERLKNANDPTKVDVRLAGFVSSFDFLPREESGTLVSLGDELEDSETARRILGQTVQDVMTRDPVTVTTNDLMKTAAETMARHRLHALPVVDAKHGNLVGIVTAKDVMRDVIKTASKALPAEENYSGSGVPADLAA